MREKLKVLDKQRIVVFAEVSSFGNKIPYRGKPIETICFCNVKDKKGNFLCDHIWFSVGKQMRKLDLEIGDKVSFTARVKEYEKGYKGRREDVYKPIETDYRLTNPTNISKRISEPQKDAIPFEEPIEKYSGLLFLDDIRNPTDCIQYMNTKIDCSIYHREWFVVRSYDEFVSWINDNGLPELISFDNDLADEHYVPKELWNDYDKSKEHQEAQEYKEKTGLECAKWLVDYCMDNNKNLPKYIVHSQNPVGADNINGLFKSYLKNVELE